MPPRWSLTITARGRTTHVSLPSAGSVVIGRSDQCDVHVDDKSVSRQHAVVHVSGGELAIEDLGSHNGTQLLFGAAGGAGDTITGRGRETRLEANHRQPLPPDAMIQIGPALITIASDDARRAATHHGDEVIVLDPAMERLYELAERVAPSDLSVLLLGESGVGKDVLARFLHSRSPRAPVELVTLNCGALPEHLLESELFGYEKGAFTGAAKSTPGLLEVATGGTLFFDEIGELSPALQVKLLRVLEGRQVMRVGGRKNIAIDVRFIAATNRDLEAEVAAGRFREDLFYRINGITLTIPPLRERPDEVAALARRFLSDAAQRNDRGALRFDDEALARLTSFAWPGNVRQLRNVVNRAAVLATGDVVSATDIQLPASAALPRAEPTLPAADPVTAAPIASTPEALRAEAERLEKARILEALEACAGNQTRAAEMLGMTRRALVGRLNKYDIARPRKGRDKK